MNKQQLWGDAVIEHPSGINASVYRKKHSDIYSSIFFLTFLVSILLVHKYIHRSIFPVLRSCFRFSQTLSTQDNLALEQGRIILFVLSLFHFSMVAFFFVQTYEVKQLFQFGWAIIPSFCLILLLFFGCRYAVFAFVGWVIQYSSDLKIIAKWLRDFFILAAFVTFPIYFSILFFWPTAVHFLTLWCIVSFLISYLFFLFRTLRYFIHLRFSFFFWILYLCSLEIAPLALLYSVIKTI